jgi:tetratricopeptide (TPR) repeat protein
MTTSQKPQPITIKGSWEDLLNQAHRAAGNNRAEASELYEKVIAGLNRLPESQRQANNGRLQELLKTALGNLHVYQTQREDYDAALATLAQLQTLVDDEERRSWQQRAAMVLAQAGRNDAALAELHSLAESPAATQTDWGNLVTLYTKLKQFDEATATIDRTAAWLTERRTNGKTVRTAAQDAADLANLACIVALAQGDWAAGIAHYDRAAELEAEYRKRPHLLYARLMFYDQPALALPYIGRDTHHAVRAGFWHGVALQRLGQPEGARQRWEQVVKTLNPRTDSEQFVEMVLTFYALGDKEGVGLNGVLRALQSGSTRSWVIHFLAGLGWLLRNNLANARTNFALAVTRRKASAEGVKLSAELWQHCTDLLNPERQAQIVEYFETEK